MPDINSLDSCFWLLETKNRPQHISAIAFADNIIIKEDLYQRILALLPVYPRLSVNVKTGMGVADPSFEPIERTTTESISLYIEELMMHDDFIGGKYWNIYIIHHVPSNTSTILFKLHHSFADGVTGLGFFHHLLFNYTRRGKGAQTQKSDGLYIPAFIRESFSLLSSLPNNTPESRLRNIHLISVPWKQTKQFLSNKKISLHVFSLYLAALIFKVVFKKAKTARFLIPVSLQLNNHVGILGNFIGASRITLDLHDNQLLSSIEPKLTKAITKERWFVYYYFSKILAVIGVYFPSFARYVSKLASSRLDSIVTSLSFNQTCQFNENISVPREFAIPALMPGQQLGFGFMRTREYLNITVISDQSVSYDKLQIIHLLESLNIKDANFL